MKVLDLQCRHQHVFEGWFASDEDFLGQCERSEVQCPVCGDAMVKRMVTRGANVRRRFGGVRRFRCVGWVPAAAGTTAFY